MNKKNKTLKLVFFSYGQFRQVNIIYLKNCKYNKNDSTVAGKPGVRPVCIGDGYYSDEGSEENFSNVCIKTGVTFKSRNCFGISEFILIPLPPATIRATFFILRKY